jgi:hypothetical protein
MENLQSQFPYNHVHKSVPCRVGNQKGNYDRSLTYLKKFSPEFLPGNLPTFCHIILKVVAGAGIKPDTQGFSASPKAAAGRRTPRRWREGYGFRVREASWSAPVPWRFVRTPAPTGGLILHSSPPVNFG